MELTSAVAGHVQGPALLNEDDLVPGTGKDPGHLSIAPAVVGGTDKYVLTIKGTTCRSTLLFFHHDKV